MRKPINRLKKKEKRHKPNLKKKKKRQKNLFLTCIMSVIIL
jgi:hypothetical protein